MRRRILTYGNYFNEFLKTLSEQEVRKLDYIISLLQTEDRLPEKFIKYIRDGLYELRISYSGNIYRVFFIFDKGAVVILFNGFSKKTQKTPEREIKKALRIKDEYYAEQE